MKFTGVSRPIDELGRIVIPKEIRKAMEIKAKDEMEFFIEDGNIILRKNVKSCALCGSEDELKSFGEKYLCSECLEKIRALME